MRRVDPRVKYSHLKIKTKGSSSPTQSSSLKRPLPEDSSHATPSSFKIPKLLQEGVGLDKPMDLRDLFKGVGGMQEAGYDDTSAPVGMFKSNFFPRSQQSEEDTKQPFGEITLTGKEANAGSQSGAKDEDVEVDGGRATSTAETNPKCEAPEVSKVPSYLAQLDVGLGSDLQIDSAFGSLAGKADSDGDATSNQGEEFQARKLPSMLW